MSIPISLTPVIFEALRIAGDTSDIRQLTPVKGGYQSKSWRLVTRRRSYLFKYHEGTRPIRYTEEVRGLELLRAAGARVPRVVAAADGTEERPGYCMQDWVHPGTAEMARRRLGARMGAEIAALHRAIPAEEGYGRPGENGERDPSWICWYRERRLFPKFERMARADRLTPERRDNLERLIERLPQWLEGVPRRPSLLHGDLHARNVLANRQGEPVLIDPQAYYGDREAEIAATHLWGGFGPAFYEGYREAWPLEDGFMERRDLYLVHCLMDSVLHGHLQLAGRLDEIVHRYVGYR